MKPNINTKLSIHLLKSFEWTIKLLLERQQHTWKSLNINYDYPNIERIYIDYNGFRISCHKILQSFKQPLYHKHRWPAVFKQLKGSYTMGITHSPHEISSIEAQYLPTLAKFEINEGSYYEMTQTDTLHYIETNQSAFLGYPNEEQLDSLHSYSIMLTELNCLYKEDRKESLTTKLEPLSNKRIQELRQIFADLL